MSMPQIFLYLNGSWSSSVVFSRSIVWLFSVPSGLGFCRWLKSGWWTAGWSPAPFSPLFVPLSHQWWICTYAYRQHVSHTQHPPVQGHAGTRQVPEVCLWHASKKIVRLTVFHGCFKSLFTGSVLSEVAVFSLRLYQWNSSPKNRIPSWFTCPHVVANPNVFHAKNIFRLPVKTNRPFWSIPHKDMKYTGHMDFFMFWNEVLHAMLTISFHHVDLRKDFLLCVFCRDKITHGGWNDMRVSKWWQTVRFFFGQTISLIWGWRVQDSFCPNGWEEMMAVEWESL